MLKFKILLEDFSSIKYLASISSLSKKVVILVKATLALIIEEITFGNIMTGNLIISRTVKLTKTILASKTLFFPIIIKQMKVVEATIIGEQSQVKLVPLNYRRFKFYK